MQAFQFERDAKSCNVRDYLRSHYNVIRDFTERTLLAWQQHRSSGRSLSAVPVPFERETPAETAPFGRPGSGICAGCSTKWGIGGLKVCSACKGQPGAPLYCSQECQKKDWRRHKPSCQATIRKG